MLVSDYSSDAAAGDAGRRGVVSRGSCSRSQPDLLAATSEAATTSTSSSRRVMTSINHDVTSRVSSLCTSTSSTRQQRISTHKTGTRSACCPLLTTLTVSIDVGGGYKTLTVCVCLSVCVSVSRTTQTVSMDLGDYVVGWTTIVRKKMRVVPFLLAIAAVSLSQPELCA